MDFELTEDQKQIKALMKEVAERETDRKQLQELADKVARARTVEEVIALQPHHLYKKLHAVGLRQLAIPEKYGGGGYGVAGHVTRAIVSEQAGYSMGIGARLLGMVWRHCAAMSIDEVTEEQKDWFFTQLMEDDTMITASCSSEPAGLTDFILAYEPKDNPGSVGKVLATKDGDEWIINGDKMFSSGSGTSGLFYVTARTDKKAPISQATTNFWVQKNTPGVSFTVNRLATDEISGNFQTYFDNVRVPERQHMKGKWGMYTAGSKHLFITAILGDAQYIYDWLVDFAKQRMGGGRPIIRHTHIAAMLGKVSLHLEAARAFVYRGAWELDQAQLAGKLLDLYWCTGSYALVKQVAWELCEIAAEVMGGIASSLDLPVESFVRRVYVWLGGGGGGINTNSIMASMLQNKHKVGEYGFGE